MQIGEIKQLLQPNDAQRKLETILTYKLYFFFHCILFSLYPVIPITPIYIVYISLIKLSKKVINSVLTLNSVGLCIMAVSD